MTSKSATMAPGSVVIVRDEEWLVTSTETTEGVTLQTVHGLSELTGQEFKTPSGAGPAVLGRAVNGWYFWRLSDGRRLKDLRDDYLRSTSGSGRPAVEVAE